MAAKIKDGLFIGDAATSQDPEFLELNKICNLVNLAGAEIPNIWAAHGLVYLTFNWENAPDYSLFDTHDEILHEIASFIDMSLRHGVSVLLFSLHGTCRCAVAACAYLMYKYGWGFEKSYDFLVIKSSEIDINRGFVQQMFQLERHLVIQKYKVHDIKQLTAQQYARLHSWEANAYLSSSTADEDERVLVNSYNNSKTTLRSLPRPSTEPPAPKAFSLSFNLRAMPSAVTQYQPAPPDAPLPVSILKTSKGSHRSKKGQLSYGSKSEVSPPPLPSENGGQSHAQPKTMNAPDLYDFVGLRPNSGDGSKHSSNQSSTAEERLHKILSNLQSSSAKATGEHRVLSSDAKYSAAMTDEMCRDYTEPISIHQLASAPISASYSSSLQQQQQQRSGVGNRRAVVSGGHQQQLRASGGVVLSSSNNQQQQQHASSGRRQQAWEEKHQDPPHSSHPVRSIRGAQQHGSTSKRYTSPAPQLSRSGLSSRTNSSNGSVSSYGSNANNSHRSSTSQQTSSNNPRGQTPPRQRPSTPTRRSQQVSSSLLQPTIASSASSDSTRVRNTGGSAQERRPASPSRSSWRY